MGGSFMKKIIWLRAAALCGMWAALSVPALAAGELIPVGEPVGIRMEVAGVLVAGTGPVETAAGPASPAEEAGIRPGDLIMAVNGTAVEHAQELAADIAALGEECASLTVLRGGREMTVSVTPALDAAEGPRLGLFLRDEVAGIGTVTYIDPETGAFGALGHGVNDAVSGALLPAAEGSVSRARVVDVTPGRPGVPGELAGSFTAGEEIGSIERNTGSGIFGRLSCCPFTPREALPVAEPDEVENGAATILACIGGAEAREYAVEIAKASFMTGTGRDLTVQVTDPALLAATGGIVQGMSGSPILQNGRLVGAVTHVLTADPGKGYGILAVNMLRAAA